ncbi:uncharacterized protein LOC124419504 [Lucilia cuprina]|uniref:uncharacterized protein LOC124419504 n=1 Tax=Lucilia cuprina TaxID=7375 RepID=UPI001F05FE97|nr:uncharacterized protein LOC124419504 [Lucilia cuprina]
MNRDTAQSSRVIADKLTQTSPLVWPKKREEKRKKDKNETPAKMPKPKRAKGNPIIQSVTCPDQESTEESSKDKSDNGKQSTTTEKWSKVKSKRNKKTNRVRKPQPDKMIISSKGEASYADILRKIRTDPELKDLGEEVSKIRRTQKGDLLLVLKSTGNNMTERFNDKIISSLDGNVDVKTHKEEIVIQSAKIILPTEAARRVLALRKIKIGIFPEQLHSLIQRFANGEGEVIKHIPESEAQGNILPRNDNKFSRNWKTKPKLSDEEIIMGKIHGTLIDEDKELRKRPAPPSMIPRGGRPDIMTPMTPMMPRGSFGGGAFDGNYQGPKMFSQSVMTKTIRKPDGTYETTKVTQDSQGNKTTTVTRTVDGKTETITTYDGAAGGGTAGHNQMLQRHADNKPEAQVYSDRNVYVSKEGYALPRNLW